MPDWGTQVPPLHASLYDGIVIVAGPVNVVFPGVAKSTWNFQYASVVVLAPSPTT